MARLFQTTFLPEFLTKILLDIRLTALILGYFCTISCYANEIVSSAGDSTDYLVKFGYLEPQDPKTGALRSREQFHSAIATFQRFAGLRITGQIDDKTIGMMNTPRCGVSDIVGTSNNAKRRRRKRYALQGSQWGKHVLTYKIIRYTTDITQTQTDHEIKKAFSVWSGHTPLTFRQIYNGRADINVAFVYGEHGDGNAFDGPKGTLAHAYFPTYGGDAHFDESETWTSNSRTGTNLLQVAAHEFGHSIGLAHSDVQASLMAPFYRGYEQNLDLHEDDISAVQELYGKKPQRTTARPPYRAPTARPPYRAPTARPHKPVPQPTEGPRVNPSERPTSDGRPPAAGAPDICKDPKLDTVTRTYDGSTYAFKGAYYWKLVRYGADSDSPRLIADDWPGLPNNLDAAFYLKSRGTTYFFKGDQYWKFMNQRKMANYPRYIKDGYPGMPTHIDAAFQWSGSGKIYFVKGNKYWRYGRNKVDYGYPRYLSKWRGLPKRIDGALQYTNRRTYFFSGDEYYKFNDRRFQVDLNYPRSIAEWWFGCSNQLERLRIIDESTDNSPWLVVGGDNANRLPIDQESALLADAPGSTTVGLRYNAATAILITLLAFIFLS